jgi:hypothetical protein
LDPEPRCAKAQLYALADAVKGGGTGWLTADRCEAILVQHNREVEGNRQPGIKKMLSSRIYIGHFRRGNYFQSAKKCKLKSKNEWAADNKRRHLLQGDRQPPLPSRPFFGNQTLAGQRYDGQASSPHSSRSTNECLDGKCPICHPPSPRERPSRGGAGRAAPQVTPAQKGMATLAAASAVAGMVAGEGEEDEHQFSSGDSGGEELHERQELQGEPEQPEEMDESETPAGGSEEPETPAGESEEPETPAGESEEPAGELATEPGPRFSRGADPPSERAAAKPARRGDVDPHNLVTCFEQLLLLNDLLCEDYREQVARRAGGWLSAALGGKGGRSAAIAAAAATDAPEVLAADLASVAKELTAAVQQLIESPPVATALQEEVAALEAHRRAAAAARAAATRLQRTVADREAFGEARRPAEQRRGRSNAVGVQSAATDSPACELTAMVDDVTSSAMAALDLLKRYNGLLQERLPARFDDLVRRHGNRLIKVSFKNDNLRVLRPSSSHL